MWQNLNFKLLPGEQVAVVGASGTGKSQLLRAIASLDPIQAGNIFFQGKPIDSYYTPQYRSQVIYLHQRPALWEGTVENNLKQVYRLTAHRHQVYNQELIVNYLQLLQKPVDFLQSLEALITVWQNEDPQRAYLWTSHDFAQLQRITNRQIRLQTQE